MHIASINASVYTDSFAASTDSSTTSATSTVSPVSRAMAKAEARLQTQLDAANAQISSFGRLKASVSDAQVAGRALTGLGTGSTAAEVKTAATRFIASFNAALTAAQTTTTASSTSSDTGASTASRVKTDLARTLGSDRTAVDALKKMGVTQAADGSLTLNDSKFDAAQTSDAAGVRATLAKFGQAVDTTATKELASNGHVTGSLTSLSKLAAQVTANKKAMVAMEQKFAAAQTSTSSSTTSSSTSSSTAAQSLAAYLTNY